MKKKVISVLLAFLLTAALFLSCAGADTQYVAELTVNGVKATATPEPTPVPTPEPVPEVTPVAADEAEPEQTAEVAPVPEDETEIMPDVSDLSEADEAEETDENEDPAAEDMIDLVDEPTAEPELTDETEDDGVLRDGSKGDAVKELQQALYDKGYLDEEPDGYFGTKTEGGVLYFQFLNDLPLTGEADEALLELLLSDRCPDAVGYPDLDFDRVNNNPAAYEGDTVSIYGRVLQTINESSEIGLRTATRGAYEDVVYIVCDNTETNAGLKEGDRVVVYGTIDGTFSYKNASGKHITLPLIRAELVVPR